MSSTEEGGGAVGAVSTDQTINKNNTNNDSVNIDMRCTDVPLSNGELANLKSLDKAFDGGERNLTANPLIRKVPSTLRRTVDFMKYFKPKVISIGPIHHDDPTLHESKELKLKLAAKFVNNIGVERESLYSNIKKEMDGLKKCYDPQELEKYRDDDEKLAWMFFVDGCAILQAVYLRYGGDIFYVYGQLFIKNDMLTFVYSDLFLLENQLPFRVLELLTSSGNGKKFMNAIPRFIDGAVINQGEDSEWWWEKQKEGERIHLLNLLRERLLVGKGKPWWWRWHLWLFTEHGSSNEARTKRHHLHNIGNVKELKKAGIWLKASKTSCLTDISFNPEDVKEMRDAGVLYNGLGSEEEVAKLFNKMNADLVPSPQIYSDVEQQIHNHCKNMLINNVAQWYHAYFRSPWSFWALVAAIAALYLSALQTYYTIHQPK
ncbi:hypothetical protein E1A91_A11G345300v1 [Gossypium mustelinum]|uniref:Uncharacterized protein n=1 Tax=Gossypium mustelinum TaxID=34275 RepID=A0A5D2XER9_GOSMU|nr:hypothetical protein E1A91_A11G345300v1 [Gossypium mustelinum]